jgi:arsenate reductase
MSRRKLMLVIGLQGSPQKKGNTNFLLSAFMNEANKLGAFTKIIEVAEKNILPCIGCGFCEKNGFCFINDDMSGEIYQLLWEADMVVAATPIFFYNATAQLKALIDRSQALWSRKYKLNLSDPGRKTRRGFLLSVGATKGKNLFEGLHLTAKYFFDALGANYNGSLTYHRIEKKGDMENHPAVLHDVRNAVAEHLSPLAARKKIMFICRENACRSQMASAFTRHLAGNSIEAVSCGSTPADSINLDMVDVMKAKGIDMAHRKPKSINDTLKRIQPEMIITMGCGDDCPFIQNVETEDWNLPDPSGKPKKFMENICNDIEKRVHDLIQRVSATS